MTFSLVLMGLTIHVLVWEKLPDWGTWFTKLIERLPAPLAYLYSAWHCPYCFGFWIALALQLLTGVYTLPELAALTETFALAGTIMAMSLDALVTALLIMVGSLTLRALALPAIKGFELTQTFKASMSQAQSTQEQQHDNT
ncbi:hypothetical protein [Pseudoalteromonas viridis]|uniref:DUF1360 domain-containing protein n=1 Tax=Pseudoalteromonas viridis TaxID=339617 RepID=A0ABX7V0T1_9GAMM|nr:hypothetical protein [Pseudoalteromonas viridis]QTL34463.1 hypothetical protein J5X90_13000 [Pseudoalteromonas viridis]